MAKNKRQIAIQTIMEYPEIFKIITEDLNMIPEQKDKLEYIMDYGSELNELEVEKRTEENMVRGCISKVFIEAQIKEDKVYFKGHADSLIVKGYVRILCEAFSGINRNEFLAEGRNHLEKFVSESKIIESLIQSRANTFGNIFGMMQKKAS